MPSSTMSSSRSQLVVVTYNVFCGAPWSWLDLNRFRRQAELLKQEAVDVLCLQEIFSENVVDAYRQVLGDEFVIVSGDPRPLSWDSITRTSESTTSLASGIMSTALSSGSKQRMVSLAAAVAILAALLQGFQLPCFLCLQCACLLRLVWSAKTFFGGSNFFSFYFGSIPGGLVTLVRKSRLEEAMSNKSTSANTGDVAKTWALSARYTDFDVQGGDLLNWMRKRGFLVVTLGLREEKAISIVSGHTNCFPTQSPRDARPVPCPHRQSQLRQVCLPPALPANDGTKIENTSSHDPEWIMMPPTVVCGDFNTNPEDGEIPLDDSQLRDAWRFCNADEMCGTLPLSDELHEVFSETKTDLCMDYQLFSEGRGLTAKRAIVLGGEFDTE